MGNIDVIKNYRNRNYMLDNLKVILIFAVVFGHVIEYYINQSVFLKQIYIFIYIFHMPLFIFISGYFSKNIKKIGRGSIKSLLIPYLIFNMIWYTAVYIGTGEFMFSILYPGWTLWYLLSLFFWRITLKYLIKIKYILGISFVTGLFIGIVPIGETVLSVSRTITFLPFFLIGYYFDENSFLKIKKVNKILCATIIVFFWIIALFIAKNDLIDYKFLYNSQSYVDFGYNLPQGMFIRSLLYLGAIIFGICVINLTPRKENLFTYIGKSTMNIYIFHIYFILIVYFIIPRWNISILRNILLLCSPIFIMYILARKRVDVVYNGILYPVNTGIKHGKVRINKYIKIK